MPSYVQTEMKDDFFLDFWSCCCGWQAVLMGELCSLKIALLSTVGGMPEIEKSLREHCIHSSHTSYFYRKKTANQCNYSKSPKTKSQNQLSGQALRLTVHTSHTHSNFTKTQYQ